MDASFSSFVLHARTEIEMVVMEKCMVSELTEQNITDEEKTAAATRTHAQRSRYTDTFLSSAALCRRGNDTSVDPLNPFSLPAGRS